MTDQEDLEERTSFGRLAIEPPPPQASGGLPASGAGPHPGHYWPHVAVSWTLRDDRGRRELRTDAAQEGRLHEEVRDIRRLLAVGTNSSANVTSGAVRLGD